MCGIVGYSGSKEPKSIILEGLKTLEYRGYDSAGVAILDGEHFKRVRAQGKLSELEAKLQDEKFDGRIGIGHTRWATHGAPSEQNAHPHSVKGVSIVHNGIIENYAELREQLVTKGAKLESQTDSELVAHLIAQEIEQTSDLLKAVLKTLPQLVGAYSILAVSEAQPNQLVAFKSGPPLLLGQGEDEVLIASDVQAIIAHTNKIIYLEDGEVAFVEGSKVQMFSRAGQSIDKKVVEVNWSAEKAEKQGYAHYMLKEIYEQPRAVAAAINPHIDLQSNTVMLNRVGFAASGIEDLAKLDEAADWVETQRVFAEVERVFIVACGTSFYAGMMGEYLIERLAKVPVEVDVASEFRYRYPVIPKNSLVILISQSGETADTLAALRLVKESGARTLSVCNVARSSIDREASGHLYMNAGPEIGVASTKALTCTMAVFNLLALAFAKAKGCINDDEEKSIVEALIATPSQMETVLVHDKFFDEAATTLKEYRGFLYMGRGANYPMALEGALKLKELAYMHAEGYASGEMKHGPLALIDKDMAVVMLAPSDELYEKTVSNLEEARARGGQVISIGSGENQKLKDLSLHYLAIPDAKWMVTPLLEVIPLQLMAYHIADRLGHDVDQPRNLAKSVTVE